MAYLTHQEFTTVSATPTAVTHLLLGVDHMKDVTEVEQLGSGYGDDLKEPEANVGDGEGQVVADVLTAGLLSVADKVGLLIAPNLERHDRRIEHSTE